jgi:hypothetical protein
MIGIVSKEAEQFVISFASFARMVAAEPTARALSSLALPCSPRLYTPSSIAALRNSANACGRQQICICHISEYEEKETYVKERERRKERLYVSRRLSTI